MAGLICAWPLNALATAYASIGELMIPMTLYILNVLSRWDKLNNKQKLRHEFCFGLLAAIIFWCKSTNVGIFIVAYLLILLHQKRNWRASVKTTLAMIGGFALITLPLLGWFWTQQALNDLVYHYFYVPLHGYSVQAYASWWPSLFARMGQYRAYLASDNYLYTIVLLILVTIFIKRHDLKSRHKLTFLMLFISYLVFCCWFGFPHDFYCLQGFIGILIALSLDELFKSLPQNSTAIKYFFTSLVIILFVTYHPVAYTRDRHQLSTQILMESINNYSEKPTLQNLTTYGDYLFIHGTNAINSNRYFHVPTFNRYALSAPFDEIIRSLAQREPDLVVSHYDVKDLQLYDTEVHVYDIEKSTDELNNERGVIFADKIDYATSTT